MYRFLDKQNGIEISWEPLDKNLGKQIVREVTGKREENPDVTEEEREKILKLYAERNNDPKTEGDVEESPKSGLTKEEIENKLQEANMQSAMLVTEITQMIQKQEEKSNEAVAELTNMMATIMMGGVQ